MEVIEGSFGKQTEEEPIDMGVHLMELIAEHGIDKVEYGNYILIVETLEGTTLFQAEDDAANTLMLLELVKLGLLSEIAQNRMEVDE